MEVNDEMMKVIKQDDVDHFTFLTVDDLNEIVRRRIDEALRRAYVKMYHSRNEAGFTGQAEDLKKDAGGDEPEKE